VDEILIQLTLILLILAALIFSFQAIRQKRAGQLSPGSFSSVLLIAIVGWIATEVMVDATGMNKPEWLSVTHFGVMILVAAVMTLQLKRSFKE
jgi:uncharacterized protein (DUF983 family)